LYSSADAIKVIKSRRSSVRDEKCIQNFSLKLERKRPIGRPMYRWKDNIKMDLKEIGHEVVDWIHLAQDWVQWWALVNMIMYLWVS
jgi:hypothetical protein